MYSYPGIYMAERQTPSIADKVAERRRKSGKAATRMVRGAGGQLQEVTGEEVQTLSQKLGRSAPPTSPAAGAQMGLTPDQTKMLGDGRQKAAALDIGMGGESQLAESGRQEQARAQSTEQEQAGIEKSQNLQALGGIGDQVYKLISKKFEDMGGEDSGEVSYDAIPALTNLRAENAAGADAIQEIINAVNSGSADLSGVVTAALNAGIPADQLSAYLPEDASQAVAGATLDYGQVTVGNMLGDLGYTAPQLTELLGGLDPTEMTVGELQEAVDATIASDLETVQEMQRMLADPTTPAALREEVRGALADAGAVGVRYSEQEAANLAEEVRRGDQITIGGTDYTIEELLNDENITEIVGEYLSATPVDREKLLEENPELAGLYQFADRHNNLLAGAKGSIGETGTKVAGEQTRRVEIASDLGDEVATALFGDGWDQYGNTQKNLPPELSHILDSKHPESSNTISGLKFLADNGVNVGGLTSDNLRAMGLDGTPEGFARFQEYQTDIEMTNANSIEEFADSLGLPADKLNAQINTVVDMAGPSLSDLRNIIAEQPHMSTPENVKKYLEYHAGMSAGDVELLMMFDQNFDGQVDDWGNIDSRLEAMTSDGTASDALSSFRTSLDSFVKDDSGLEDRRNSVAAKLQEKKNIAVREGNKKFVDSLPGNYKSVRGIGGTDVIRNKKDEAVSALRSFEDAGADMVNDPEVIKLKTFIQDADTVINEDTRAWYKRGNVIAEQLKQFNPHDIPAFLNDIMNRYEPGNQSSEVAKMLLEKYNRSGEENLWSLDSPV